MFKYNVSFAGLLRKCFEANQTPIESLSFFKQWSLFKLVSPGGSLRLWDVECGLNSVINELGRHSVTFHFNDSSTGKNLL